MAGDTAAKEERYAEYPDDALFGDLRTESPADLRGGQPPQRGWRSVIGPAVVAAVAILLVLAIALHQRPVFDRDLLRPTRTVREGDKVWIKSGDGQTEVHVVHRGLDYFIPSQTLGTVRDTSHTVPGRTGQFYGIEIDRGDLQGKRMNVEEHDLDLGWSLPEDKRA
jgi:hypothetical protein